MKTIWRTYLALLGFTIAGYGWLNIRVGGSSWMTRSPSHLPLLLEAVCLLPPKAAVSTIVIFRSS